jgi:hypothetical protein
MHATKQSAIMSILLAVVAMTPAAADNTAEAFFRPAPDRSQDYDPDKLRVRVLSGPTRVATAHDKPVEYPPVAILDVAYNEGRCLFLANSANEPVRVLVEGLPKVPVRMENLFEPDEQPIVPPGKFELALEPLEVKGYRFSRADE